MPHCWQPGCPNPAIINDAWCMAHCPDGTPVTRLRAPTLDTLPPGVHALATPAGFYGFRAERVLTDAERAQIEGWLNARYNLF